MNTYFRSIVLTMALGHILLLLTGELGGEHSKRFLRYLYGLILLLTIFAPLRTCVEDITKMVDDLHTIFATEAAGIQSQNDATTESTYTYAAKRIAVYVSEQYAIPQSDIYVTIYTDENDNVQQVEIGVRNCDYALRQTIARELQEKAEIPITVNGG